MHYLREHLVIAGYNWLEKVDFSGTPSRRLFDRFDGNQVLFIINTIASEGLGFSLQQAREAEQRIRQQLPLEPKSEITVFNWILAKMQDGGAVKIPNSLL